MQLIGKRPRFWRLAIGNRSLPRLGRLMTLSFGTLHSATDKRQNPRLSQREKSEVGVAAWLSRSVGIGKPGLSPAAAIRHGMAACLRIPRQPVRTSAVLGTTQTPPGSSTAPAGLHNIVEALLPRLYAPMRSAGVSKWPGSFITCCWATPWS